MQPIPYGKQEILEEDIQAVTEALKAKFLTQGPMVLEFEKKFSTYVGSKYSLAVANGTAALHLAVLALGVKPGQKVLCTAISFAASANCVLYCGGKLEFVDIDPKNYCIDIKKLKEKIEGSPTGTYAGVIVVDFAGYPVDLEKIHALTREHRLWLLEDACHAPGGAFLDSHQQWQKCGNGNFADLAIFSFHPVKHIASGEGGMITTNQESLYKKILLLRTHGINKDPQQIKADEGGWYYEMQELGYNYRMPDILCALAMSQLGRAEVNLAKRHKIAERYDREFSDLPVVLPARSSHENHAFHLYIVLTENRKALYDYLHKKNIFPQVHYVPIPDHPYYKKQGYSSDSVPCSKDYYQKCLSLPMFHSMTEEEQSYVIKTVRDFYLNNK